MQKEATVVTRIHSFFWSCLQERKVHPPEDHGGSVLVVIIKVINKKYADDYCHCRQVDIETLTFLFILSPYSKTRAVYPWKDL